MSSVIKSPLSKAQGHPVMVGHLLPAGVAIIIAVGIMFVFGAGEPLIVSNGVMTPNAGKPGDKLAVNWTQEWRELCSVTVTRELSTPDGWVKNSAPFKIEPPDKVGIIPRSGVIVVPPATPGDAQYRAKLEPHCFVDRFWQRSYHTPAVSFSIQAVAK